ncbi:hypothetical protein [Flavobacterium restrictum]|uniref:Lipoprotein n=1 Tax=Flavobacterium restrictum TaxID=2594428 RepID=A0A553DSA7_9FLAO|nr:hypothetical protein [Flavobacterium restrictum]TRX35639.1 hypothetical protein FNW21_14670 [Flavobacterium restrictum]
MPSIAKNRSRSLFLGGTLLLALLLWACHEKKTNTTNDTFKNNPETKKYKFDENVPPKPELKKNNPKGVSSRHRKGKISCGDTILKQNSVVEQ